MHRPFRIELSQKALSQFFNSPYPKKFILDRVNAKIKESRKALNEASKLNKL